MLRSSSTPSSFSLHNIRLTSSPSQRAGATAWAFFLLVVVVGVSTGTPIMEKRGSSPAELGSSSSDPHLPKPQPLGHGARLSMNDVHDILSDPSSNWQRDIQDPGFLLMNEEQPRRRRRQFPRTSSKPSYFNAANEASDDEDALRNEVDRLLEDYLRFSVREGTGMMHRPLGDRVEYVPSQETPLSRVLMPSKRAGDYRLSLTNNLDVLREKLYMEIARRNRLSAQNQIESANSALVTMG